MSVLSDYNAIVERSRESIKNAISIINLMHNRSYDATDESANNVAIYVMSNLLLFQEDDGVHDVSMDVARLMTMYLALAHSPIKLLSDEIIKGQLGMLAMLIQSFAEDDDGDLSWMLFSSEADAITEICTIALFQLINKIPKIDAINTDNDPDVAFALALKAKSEALDAS